MGIFAVLSVAVILVINPAETLRRGRDATRLSDLSAIKSAIGLYLTEVSATDLDTGVANHCFTGQTGQSPNTVALISYSIPQAADPACAVALAVGTDVSSGNTWGVADRCRYVPVANSGAVTGSGWIPVDLSAISSGSPLSNFPTDPTNTFRDVDGAGADDALATTPDYSDLAYRYACQQSTLSAPVATGKPQPVFEITAVLESDQYTVTNDVDGTDGGEDANMYETGTAIRLIPDSDAY